MNGLKLGETWKTANFASRVDLLDQKANQFQDTSSGSDVLKVYSRTPNTVLLFKKTLDVKNPREKELTFFVLFCFFSLSKCEQLGLLPPACLLSL